MFKRSFTQKEKPGKSSRWNRKRRSHGKSGKHGKHSKSRIQDKPANSPLELPLASPIIVLIVSKERRLFVAHEDVLSRSPYFRPILRDLAIEDHEDKVVELLDEEPEVMSCILEFLYKGDYYPSIVNNELENAQASHSSSYGSSEPTIFHHGANDVLLRDTVVYCAAEKYGLEDLKRLALRKQGLQSAVPVSVILRSARYAYENTPDSDSQLRAHYLAMIIRTRDIFKRSGTMQIEMEDGHSWFFDLFVAMCNHMDDLDDFRSKRAPKTQDIL